MPTKTALAMAPPFRPWKAGEAPEHGNSLISTFFKRSRKGRPKKSGTLAADKVKVNVVKHQANLQGQSPRSNALSMLQRRRSKVTCMLYSLNWHQQQY